MYTTNYGRSSYGRGQYGKYRRHVPKQLYSRVNGIPRSQQPTKISRAQVRQIAKKVVDKDNEMKMFDNSLAQSLTQGAWYVTNLWSGWTQNPSSVGHIGRKINLQRLKFRVSLAAFNSATEVSGSTARFMVFKTSQQLTAGTSVSVPQGNLFRTNPGLFDVALFPDPSSVDVLADVTRVINPGATGSSDNVRDFFTIDIPHKQVLNVVAGENNSYFKEDNFYVYFAMQDDNGTVTTAGAINFGWEMCYTDA